MSTTGSVSFAARGIPRGPLDPAFHDLTGKLAGFPGLIALVIGCDVTGVLGVLAAERRGGLAVLGTSALGEPAPPAVIGLVLALFTLMAISVWIVIRRTARRPDQRRHAVATFAGQLLLHTLWLPLLHVPAVALVIAMVLAASLAWTMTWFWSESRTAGILLIPALAWVGIVTAFTSAAAIGS